MTAVVVAIGLLAAVVAGLLAASAYRSSATTRHLVARLGDSRPGAAPVRFNASEAGGSA
jgi:hypothetical protein